MPCQIWAWRVLASQHPSQHPSHETPSRSRSQPPQRLKKPPRVKDLEGQAEPVGLEPTHPHGRQFSRLVQYQLCDGSKRRNTVGAPGFEPGTSASRTQRSTELSHAPKSTINRPKPRSYGKRGPSYSQAEGGGIELERIPQRPRWPSCTPSGRGGIRTHVGINPHDFQSCALSRSATRPNSDLVSAVQLPTAPRTTVRRLGSRIPHLQQDILQKHGGSGIRTHADLRPTP